MTWPRTRTALSIRAGRAGPLGRSPCPDRPEDHVSHGGSLPTTVIVLLALVCLASCTGDVATYGVMDPGAEGMGIVELLEAPELHLGKEVRVSGLVVEVCQEIGCWFEVMEEDRRLMVDLKLGTEFTIPEGSAGRWAVVVGTFVREEGALKIIGKGVELRDRQEE